MNTTTIENIDNLELCDNVIQQCQSGCLGKCFFHVVSIIIGLIIFGYTLKAICNTYQAGLNYETITFALGNILALITIIECYFIYHDYEIIRPYLLLLIQLSIAYQFTKLYIKIRKKHTQEDFYRESEYEESIEVQEIEVTSSKFLYTLMVIIETVLSAGEFVKRREWNRATNYFDIYWFGLLVCYAIMSMPFIQQGKKILKLIEKKEKPETQKLMEKKKLKWFAQQSYLTSQKRQIQLLLYGFLPTGGFTFVIQMVADIIVYEEHIIAGLKTIRNLFEMVPVFILIWVFKEINNRQQINQEFQLDKDDIVWDTEYMNSQDNSYYKLDESFEKTDKKVTLAQHSSQKELHGI